MNQQLDRPTAYTLEPHPFFMGSLGGDPMPIKHSANAWWMDRVKVYALLIGFRYGANIKEACNFAGISTEQWKYFNEMHPDFSHLKDRVSAVMDIQAGFVINKAIEKGDGRLAWRWLAMRQPARFGSARERLFWAKLAIQQMSEENSEEVRTSIDRNIEVARELVEQGKSDLTPVDAEGYPLEWKRAGHWVRRPGAEPIK